jgi:hypothetical protein
MVILPKLIKLIWQEGEGDFQQGQQTGAWQEK